MNLVLLLGNLVKDPVIFAKVTKITLAVDKDDDNCDYIEVSLFGSAKTFADKYLEKGRLIQLEGKVETNKYIDKQGKTKYTTDIVSFHIRALDKPKAKNEGKVE